MSTWLGCAVFWVYGWILVLVWAMRENLRRGPF